MWGRIMVELGRREELYPFGQVVDAEDAEIGFKFLIGSLGLSVGLRVVGGRESDIVFEEMC